MSTNAIAFKDLPLSDNFMFGQVMRDERVSKLFLEALLGRSIAKIEYIDKEKDLSDTLGAHESALMFTFRIKIRPDITSRCSA